MFSWCQMIIRHVSQFTRIFAPMYLAHFRVAVVHGSTITSNIATSAVRIASVGLAPDKNISVCIYCVEQYLALKSRVAVFIALALAMTRMTRVDFCAGGVLIKWV